MVSGHYGAAPQRRSSDVDATKRKQILRALLLVILVAVLLGLTGCELVPEPSASRACVVAKPVVSATETESGDVRLSPEDAAELLIYIQALEACIGD